MTNQARLDALQDALKLKQQELNLIKSIDEIRDTTSEPVEMLTSIVNLISQNLQAELCLLFLLGREAGELRLKVANKHDRQLDRLQEHITNHLAQRAAQLDEITVWQRDQLSELFSADMPDQLQIAAVPIIMGSEQRLGAMMIVHLQRPFGPDELQLLGTAEDQIDSAIIQGTIYDRSQQARKEIQFKQRELETIDAIDRVRDTTTDPVAMITAIVNLMAERFETELCLLFLIDRESGEIDLKAMNDQSQRFGELERHITRGLAERAAQLDDIEIWDKHNLSTLDTNKLPEQIQVAAVPIIMGADERLGALLLVRTQKPFDSEEMQLLSRAEDQIDSAIIQAYAKLRHQQFVKELETVYRIDLIRDQELPFKEMLDAVLQEVLHTITAEMGFIMLYDRSGRQLEVRAASPEDLFQMSPYYDFVSQAANDSLERGELVHRVHEDESSYSLMCLPLILNHRIIGVLGALSRQQRHGFTTSDRRLLRAIGSQVDTAIFEQREKRRLRQVLGRSVDPQVMKRLLDNPDTDILKGERQELTVLYADIRGSTQLAEQSDPELLVQFINDYLGEMTAVILSREGTLDKFVGDEVMALFGAPFPQQDHALRAVQVGLMMQAAHQEIMKKWREQGMETAPIGIGIATGEMIVGEMGCAQRTDYTVIGRAANLGARICNVATRDQVLISQRTYDLVKDRVDTIPIPHQRFKGLDNDVTIYHVIRMGT